MENEFRYIETSIEDSIAQIRLNRPDVLNALNRSMVKEIITALQDFNVNEQVKVIVLSGKGRAFAAGADIDEMAENTPITMELLDPFADWDEIYRIKKPIICAVHGYCLGGGFELALSADILIAAENTKFGFPEVKLGVMPGAGGTQLLTRLIGKNRALEWLWTGEMRDVTEAYQLGIVNRIVPKELLLEETLKFAQVISKQPPLSLRLIKEASSKAFDYTLHEGMQFERKNFYLLFATEDQKEGMKAFLEKRKPNFQGK